MKEYVGIITIVLSIVGHTPYIVDAYKQKTKPHFFTWLIWSIVVGLVFFGQVAKGGGAGAWSTGATAVIVVIITLLALRNKRKDITKSDKIFFILALLAIIPWYFANDPTLSVVMATGIDALAFLPTMRKTLKDPTSETFVLYPLNVLRHGLSIYAISSYNLATVIYPAYLFIANGLMTLIILRPKLR